MIHEGYKDCAVRQYSQKGSNDPEEVRKRAMNDPEVQQIMGDPAMRMILEQMQSDPQAVQVRGLTALPRYIGIERGIVKYVLRSELAL